MLILCMTGDYYRLFFAKTSTFFSEEGREKKKKEKSEVSTLSNLKNKF